MSIAIETYENIPITLDLARGLFCATIDDDEVTDPTIRGLKEQLTTIAARLKDARRRAQQPVSAIILHATNQSATPRLVACTILGIHAGRKNNKTLRVVYEDGKKNSLEMSYVDSMLYCLNPEDITRVRELAHLLHVLDTAKHALSHAEDALKNYKRTMPQVEVPCIDTKSSAVQAEPAFLTAVEAAIKLS